MKIHLHKRKHIFCQNLGQGLIIDLCKYKLIVDWKFKGKGWPSLLLIDEIELLGHVSYVHLLASIRMMAKI